MAASRAKPAPLLTVMISPREGHFLTLKSLASVLADDALAFDVVYVDILSPPDVAAAIGAVAAERGFPVIRHDRWIAPAAARKAALSHVKTPYVAFIDNDIFVERGTFKRLVECAEETGAGLVGPIYLQGASAGAMSIHMAGGDLAYDAAGRITSETHLLADAPLEAARALVRREVDFLEYHCLLARTELVMDPAVISDDVLVLHEHIDVALAARERGFGVWIEPAARVNFASADRGRLADLAFFRERWGEAACEASLDAFVRRRPVADPEAFFAPVRNFYRDRQQFTATFHARAKGADLDRAMAPAELAQTRTALREQAQSHAYDAAQIKALELACDFATLIHDSVYRPDGRPFLNHVIGTASALIRYDLRQEVVLAGLLHAAYTHRPAWMEAAEVTRLLTSGGVADRIVRGLPTAKAQLARGAVVGDLTRTEVWALAVEAANETDMLISGEYRACGRPREIPTQGIALLGEVLGLVGAPGLAASAAGGPGEGAQSPILGFARMHGSFWLDARSRRVHPIKPIQ
jgi:GT2 family glycosyltransferase